MKKTATATAAPDTVTLPAYGLELFGYHVSCLMRDTGKFGLSPIEGVHAEVEIVPGNLSRSEADPIWDQCWLNGHWVGNRCGAVRAFARLVAGHPRWYAAVD